MRNTFQCLIIAVFLMTAAGCASVAPKTASYYTSDEYFKEVAEEEKVDVMDCYYGVLRHISKKEYKEAIKYASSGIDNIPRYKSVFTFFYAMRGYSYIMLYDLEKGMADIKNIENIDKKSTYVPCLYTYYYMSYAPFDSDPDLYYKKALEYLKLWQDTKPKNYFENFLYDSQLISKIEMIIKEGMNK